MTRHRTLPDGVVVQADLDIDDLWDRFEIFEALHHNLAIATPMSDRDLDRVVELLEPSSGDDVLDVACGRGELLRRLRQWAPINGVGVDLSPWMIAGAAEAAATDGGDTVEGTGENSMQWLLADAKSLLSTDDGGNDAASQVVSERQWNTVCCLGASWIWYGLRGTIRAVANLVQPGGLVAIGDMHIRPGIEPAAVLQSHGRVDSLPDIDHWFTANDVDIIGRVTTSDDSWAAYHDRVDAAAASWADDRGLNDRRVNDHWDKDHWDKDHWVNEANAWRAAAERDRPVLTWSVWVGRKRAGG